VPRFYFHLHRNETSLEDDDGMELPDLSAAQKEAHQSAMELFIDAIRFQGHVEKQHFEVQDNVGNIVFTLPFQDIVKFR
jgi:hypothetical protein